MIEREAPTEADRRQLRGLWTLLALAGAALVICALFGLMLVAGDPDPGSTADDLLRGGLAASGLAVAVLAGAAAVFAQVRNLWRFAPLWFRYTTWAVLAAVVLAGMKGRALGG